MDHLQLALINITVDAGTCTSVQLDARDATGRPVTNPGPTLDWELQPTGWVQTFANSTCAMSPATYGAGLPQVKTGYIKADKFGQSSVYPTVVNPPSGYSQGQPVAVRSMATLTGFPASLPYDVCSPITLTASAQALTDTTLNFSSPTPGASFTFNGSGCGNNVSPIIISALSSSTTGFARSNTGGTVQLFSMSGVLRFTPVAVTLTRPDAGTACLGDSIGCGAPAQCCSDVCAFGTCQGPPATP